jgi:hypothetical protein
VKQKKINYCKISSLPFLAAALGANWGAKWGGKTNLLPSPFFGQKFKQPFTKQGSVLDREVMNTESSLVFGAANNTPFSQSIFLFLAIPLPKESRPVIIQFSKDSFRQKKKGDHMKYHI